MNITDISRVKPYIQYSNNQLGKLVELYQRMRTLKATSTDTGEARHQVVNEIYWDHELT